jgi:hypothetical protein
MHVFLTLLAVGAGIAWLLADRYKPGESPFDQLPAGVSPSPAGSTNVKASSGNRYEVSHWVPQGDQQFHVAELKGKPAWISYWATRSTGARTLHKAHASAGELNAMRKDFDV